MDKDFEKFLKWYQGNEEIFHQFQYDQKQVAYGAYLKGKHSALDEIEERLLVSSHLVKIKADK